MEGKIGNIKQKYNQGLRRKIPSKYAYIIIGAISIFAAFKVVSFSNSLFDDVYDYAAVGQEKNEKIQELDV